MIRDSVTCDVELCDAFFLERPDMPEGMEFKADVAAHGWEHQDGVGDICPPCLSGNGPVLERGECARCGGRSDTFDICMYCGHHTPYVEEPDSPGPGPHARP